MPVWLPVKYFNTIAAKILRPIKFGYAIWFVLLELNIIHNMHNLTLLQWIAFWMEIATKKGEKRKMKGDERKMQGKEGAWKENKNKCRAMNGKRKK